ncbi:MAG: hypothetical protein JWN95_625 [Frankiales bacterium]|nr:hypothetical protein [Frankiales bacterium]
MSTHRGHSDEQPRPPSAFRRDIQGLRAVAVVLVALNHAGLGIFPGGYVGVDVFFVISGFLITGVLLGEAQAGSLSLRDFYARRARRILPAGSLVVIVVCIAAVHIMDFVDARKVLVDAVWATFFSANIRFMHQTVDYFNHDAASPLQHYWSLAVEEQFYVVWPIAILLTLAALRVFGQRHSGSGRPASHRPRSSTRPLAVWIAVPLTIIAVASLSLSIAQTTQTSTSPYFSTIDRAWELAAGGLVALGLPLLGRTPVWARGIATWAGAAAIIVAATVFDSTTPFPGSAALLPVAGACALIVGGIGKPSRGFNRILTTRPFAFIGDISYSLYLWHWPVLVLGAAWAGHALTVRQNCLLLLLALLLSVASFRLIEDPVRRSKRLWGRRPRRALVMWPVAVLVTLLVVVEARPSAPGFASDYSATNAFQQLAPADQVKQSIAAAQRGVPIPGDLKPALQDIKSDFKSIGDCSGYRKTSNQICQYGDPNGTKTIVLFGNSHATMWVPAMAEIAKQAHVRLYPLVKESCDYPTFEASSGQCAVWYRWALTQISALHPDTIVMGGDLAGGDWQSALKRSVTELKARSDDIRFLELAPGLRQAPDACLLRKGATLGSCMATTPAQMIASSEAEGRIVSALGARYVRVRQWFCVQATCPAVVGSIVTYADVGHVTETYALHVAPALAAALALGSH